MQAAIEHSKRAPSNWYLPILSIQILSHSSCHYLTDVVISISHFSHTAILLRVNIILAYATSCSPPGAYPPYRYVARTFPHSHIAYRALAGRLCCHGTCCAIHSAKDAPVSHTGRWRVRRISSCEVLQSFYRQMFEYAFDSICFLCFLSID